MSSRERAVGTPLQRLIPILYHGVTRFDPGIGILPKAAGKATYTQIFGD